jgi:hypothetical protein
MSYCSVLTDKTVLYAYCHSNLSTFSIQKKIAVLMKSVTRYVEASSDLELMVGIGPYEAPSSYPPQALMRRQGESKLQPPSRQIKKQQN